MKQNIIKILLALGVLGYCIWPFDIAPGSPLDDILVAVVTLESYIIAQRKRNGNQSWNKQ